MTLRTPIVPSASPRSERVENVQRMADAGAAAVVFHSLFGEQGQAGAAGGAEEFRISPETYCEHIRAAKKLVPIPLIGSLNVRGAGDWVAHARRIEDAGADALELNIQNLPDMTYRPSGEIEREVAETVYLLKQSLRIPLAVKLTPFYTNLFRLAAEVQEAGANGLTLFNRFVQPAIGEKEAEFEHVPLSTTMDMRLPMHWIAVLAPRLQLSLAASGGLQRAADAVSFLAAGADVTMACSVLLRRGIAYIAELEQSLTQWMTEHGHTRIADFKGTASFSPWVDPGDAERKEYIHVLSHSEHRLEGV
jgi:dihydroorotate dehydrogenase (fumarate)